MMAKAKKAAMPLAVSKTVVLQLLRSGDAINARRTGRDTALNELKASILAHGVVQSLRVRLIDESHYEVIAGNRRLLALQGLEKEGKIGPDYEVPVIVSVIDDAAAHELSVVENVERVPVSPVDEFKAFSRLHDEGNTVDAIAERFGVPVRRVQQRMKLAALHPDVLEALEAGTITLDAAAAFTVQADTDVQQSYLRDAIDGGRNWMLGPRDIRTAMTSAHVKSDSALAQLIGETAYMVAGGEILPDLFANATYWTSAAIVQQLADAHWQAQTDTWLAEGWAWVAPASDYPNLWNFGRHYASRPAMSAADETRLGEIEEEMNGFEGLNDEPTEAEQATYDALEAEQVAINEHYALAYTAEQMAGSGVIYEVDGSRTTFGVIDHGKVEAAAGTKPASTKVALPPEDPAAVGPAVSETLSAVLSDALRTEIAADPDLALPLLAAFMAAGQAGRTLPAHMTVGHIEATRDGKQGQSIGSTFAYFNRLPDEELLAEIARMFANTIDVRDGFLTSTKYVSITARPAMVAELVDIVVPRHFPLLNTDAYFNGVKKPLIAAAFKEITGDAIKDGKKGDMADTTAKLAIESGWLPMALRNGSYEGPGAADAVTAEAAE